MKFLHPFWLWALLAVPFAWLLLRNDELRRERKLSTFVDRSLWSRIVPERDAAARARKIRLGLLSLAFVFVALARPQWGSHEETIHVTGLDVMVVLDVSNSMEVEDVPPSRLKKAKHLVKSFVDRLRGDRVGAVAFAGSSYVASPLTTDLEYLYEVIQILSPRSILNQGTDIGTGLETALRSLERGAEEVPAAQGGKTASQAIILISDGEDHQEGATKMAEKLKSAGIRLYVLGVGTERGGPIPLRDESGALRGYKKERGQAVVSSFKPDALMQVAAAAGGRYWNITPGEGELDELLQDLGALNRGDLAERRQVVYEDRFQIPLALALLLLLWEMAVPVRRQGALAALLAAALLGGCVSPENYFRNQKGIEAFNSDKVEEARQLFGAAQARDPDSPELKFNQGDVQMKQEEFDSAIRGFSESARSARERQDPALAGRALYNLGSALAKKSDLGGAVDAFSNAIEEARKSKDARLEKDARKRIEQLIAQQDQDKKEKKDDQQKKDQDQQQQQAQQKQQDQEKKDQEKQDQEKQDQKEKEDQQQAKNQQSYEQTRKQKFRSLKLSDEDAERVMAELKNRERQLQGKLKKQNGKPQGDAEKDW